MNVTFDFDSPDDFATFACEHADPVQTILANQTNDRKKEILRAVTEAARKYEGKNTEIVRFENEAILIVGKK
jgi:hypothetical protein